MSDVTTPAHRTCSVIEGRYLLQEYADHLGRANKTDAMMRVLDCLVHYPKPRDLLDPAKTIAAFSVPE